MVCEMISLRESKSEDNKFLNELWGEWLELNPSYHKKELETQKKFCGRWMRIAKLTCYRWAINAVLAMHVVFGGC